MSEARFEHIFVASLIVVGLLSLLSAGTAVMHRRQSRKK
jgi:Tfp pilus assembly protein PilX